MMLKLITDPADLTEEEAHMVRSYLTAQSWAAHLDHRPFDLDYALHHTAYYLGSYRPRDDFDPHLADLVFYRELDVDEHVIVL